MKRNLFNYFPILVFLYIMIGNHAWFTWFLKTPGTNYMIYTLITGAFLSYLYKSNKHLPLNTKTPIILGFLCLFIAYEAQFETLSFGSLLNGFCFILPLWILVSDVSNNEIILKNILNILAVILGIGIILYLYMVSFGIIPGIPIQHPSNRTYLYLNHMVY